MEARVESGIEGSKHYLVTTQIQREAQKNFKQQPRRVWHFKRSNYNGLRSFFQGFPRKKSCPTTTMSMMPLQISLKLYLMFPQKPKTPPKPVELLLHLSRTVEVRGIPPLQRADGALVVDPYEKADLLANNFIENSFLSVPIGINPPSFPFHGSQMSSLKITEEAVLRNLNILVTSKATGPDGIPARILKMFASELAPILSEIFRIKNKNN